MTGRPTAKGAKPGGFGGDRRGVNNVSFFVGNSWWHNRFKLASIVCVVVGVWEDRGLGAI